LRNHKLPILQIANQILFNFDFFRNWDFEPVVRKESFHCTCAQILHVLILRRFQEIFDFEKVIRVGVEGIKPLVCFRPLIAVRALVHGVAHFFVLRHLLVQTLNFKIDWWELSLLLFRKRGHSLRLLLQV